MVLLCCGIPLAAALALGIGKSLQTLLEVDTTQEDVAEKVVAESAEIEIEALMDGYD